MPPTAPPAFAPGASSRPAHPAPCALVAPAKSPFLGASPASRRGDAPDSSPALPEPAPARPRGRGHGHPKPAAPLPAVTARDPLWRILTIHRILAERPRRPPTAGSLAKEIGISPRTIQRDIATMQHTLRLPIESLAGNGGGYRYTRRHVEFATATATPSELLALGISAQMARAYAGARLEAGVIGALQKLRRDGRTGPALDLDALGEVLSFRGTGFDLLTDLDLFQRVTLAALNREELTFSYLGGEDDHARARTARPLHVYSAENAWYVLSRDVPSGEIRRFALGRMRRVRATGRRFERTREDELAVASVDDALGAFGGGKPVRVVLRFRGRAARAVQERRWHRSQKVRAVGPREVELELRVAETPGLLYFVLRWGGDARVLEPASLRAAVRDHARAMLEQG